jgi:hypothetical protein
MIALHLDTIDSCIQDEAAIVSSTPSTGIATTTTWQPLTTGIYDGTVGGDASFLIMDAVNGTVTTSATAGFTYSFAGKLSLTGIDQNTPIEFAILADGVAVGFIASVTGGHNSRPLSVDVGFITLSTPASTVYTIGVQTPDGVQTIAISDIALGVTINPTNNPT